MKIKIISVEKTKEQNMLELEHEYLKRCRGWKIEITQKVEAKSPKQYWVVMDEKGENPKTLELAQKLEKVAATGKEICFLIGAADGHSKQTIDNADYLLSFGKLTWAHKLARVMLTEQIYRVWSISNNHPYHRE
jgi:23S rRNA (pseudouridine1915-N3)-methyltransferase